MIELWAVEFNLFFPSFFFFFFFDSILFDLIFFFFWRSRPVPLQLHVLCSFHWRSDRARRQMTEQLFFFYEKKNLYESIRNGTQETLHPAKLCLWICHSGYFNTVTCTLHVPAIQLNSNWLWLIRYWLNDMDESVHLRPSSSFSGRGYA